MKQVKTFPKGVHTEHHKDRTEALEIAQGPLPAEVILPLQQHAGVVCQPLVGASDQVLAGQKIAEAAALISAPLHAPVSGVVKAIEPREHLSGLKLMSIVVKVDPEQRDAPPLKRDPRLSAEEIVRVAREAGIVGLGGAAFPTHVKLSPPPGIKIDSVILNGCECEPYLTGDHRLMVEEPDAVIDGLKLIMTAVGAEKGYIGIETNKPDAIDIFSAKTAREDSLRVVALEAKYPQGSEKHLIKAVLDREVPSRRLPSHVGALVQNVGTALALSRAAREGRPLTQRVITVSGSGINRPRNLRAYLGTPVKELIEFCGGLTAEAAKVIVGGPMMGVALAALSAPVIKATSGIIALSRADLDKVALQPCIKCGRCVQACPMGLMPNRLGAISEVGIWEELEDESIFDCVECGSCSFVCPARRPLVQYIKLGKYQLSQEVERQNRKRD